MTPLYTPPFYLSSLACAAIVLAANVAAAQARPSHGECPPTIEIPVTNERCGWRGTITVTRTFRRDTSFQHQDEEASHPTLYDEIHQHHFEATTTILVEPRRAYATMSGTHSIKVHQTVTLQCNDASHRAHNNAEWTAQLAGEGEVPVKITTRHDGTYRIELETPPYLARSNARTLHTTGGSEECGSDPQRLEWGEPGEEQIPGSTYTLTGEIPPGTTRLEGAQMLPARPLHPQHTHITWNLRRSGLVARIRGPLTVERGNPFSLDATPSQGHPRTYQWTLTPTCSEHSPGTTTKSGMRTTFVPLCDTQVTLEVSDGTDTDQQSVTVKVTPRAWKTPVTHKDDWAYEAKGPLSHPPHLYRKNDRTVDLDVVFGENLCAPDSLRPTTGGGILHPHRSWRVDTWLDNGYTVAQVDDPDGPFHQWWFVASSELKVDRKGIFNLHIRPDAAPSMGAQVNFYNFNKAKGIAIDEVLRAIERHEGWGFPRMSSSGHTQIMKEVVDQQDPRGAIEALFRRDRNALEKQANETLRAIDQEMMEKSSALDRGNHPHDPSGAGNLWVWNRSDREWQFVPAKEP